MKNDETGFMAKDGREMLLDRVEYIVEIDGLMATTKLSQHYINPYKSAIEAVYTFPMAPDAVLLGIRVQIGERILEGEIVEKKEAEARYEEGIDEGNRAVMVEKQSNGLYTVNLANLMSEEKIAIHIEYVQLLHWKQNRVRWMAPTTLTPKYGEAKDLGLDDVSDPAFSLLAENRFTFRMRIRGVLAESAIDAPSVRIRIDRQEKETLVTLEKEWELMDKNIILNFHTEREKSERSFVLTGRDFDGTATIVSFYPDFGLEAAPREPKSVCFVIDCSGSMHGVSIQRARSAISQAVELLNQGDSFNIIRFGSGHEKLFDREVPATASNRAIAQRLLDSLNADMGGTEMQSALLATYAAMEHSPYEQRYLFLVTDGAIYDHSHVIDEAKASGISHYVVGVGYASDSELLSKLASRTKGSFESIDPNERMDEHILELFKKIDTPKALDVEIRWPQAPRYTHHPITLFEGDTFYAYAAFDGELPDGEIELRYMLENGEERREKVKMDMQTSEEENPSVVARLVAAQNILKYERASSLFLVDHGEDSIKQNRVVELSIRYELFSSLTNYLLVDEVDKEQKSKEVPMTMKVKNMIPDLFYLRTKDTSIDDDVLGFPVFLRKQMDSFNIVKKPVSQDLLNSSITPTMYNVSLEKILKHLDEDERKEYLYLLDEWFKTYGRLPKKKSELYMLGFEENIILVFNDKYFGRLIRDFTIMLHRSISDIGKMHLSYEFKNYLSKIDDDFVNLTPYTT